MSPTPCWSGTGRCCTFDSAHPALHDGDLHLLPLVDGGDVVVFERTNGGDRVLVAANLGETSAVVDVPSGASLVLSSAAGNTVRTGSVSLVPNSAVIVDLA